MISSFAKHEDKHVLQLGTLCEFSAGLHKFSTYPRLPLTFARYLLFLAPIILENLTKQLIYLLDHPN